MISIDQFFAFARTETVNGVTTVTKYPLSLSEVAMATTISDMERLINNMPENHVAVLKEDSPAVDGDYYVVSEKMPIQRADGHWYRNFETIPRSLEEIDALVKTERRLADMRINAGREAANYNYFLFQGKRIACDTLSRSDLDGTNHHINNRGGVMPTNWVGGWKTKDNEVIPFNDVETWRAMYGSMYDQGQINFMHSQTLKAMVQQASTLQAIRNIDWRTKTQFNATPLPEHDIMPVINVDA